MIYLRYLVDNCGRDNHKRFEGLIELRKCDRNLRLHYLTHWNHEMFPFELDNH